MNSPADTPRGGRVSALDGLRALAIGSVLIFHCFRVPQHSSLVFAEHLGFAGWGGVDIFFALSGFLVGGILIDGRGRPHQLRDFLIRRFVRIVPLYAIVVASFLVMSALLPYEWLFGNANPVWAYATLTQNFAVPVIGHDALYLGPTWSLAVEAQIYIALGFLLTRIPAKSILPAMVAGIVLAEGCRLIATATGHGIFGYFTVPARVDGACFGVVAAIIIRSDNALALASRWSRLIWIATACLIAGAVLLGAAGQGIGSPGANLYTHFALALASSAIIVVVIATPDSWQSAALRWRPFVELGTISYGVYLLHVPAIGLTHAMLDRPGFVLSDGRAVLATVLGLAIAIAVAALSWRYLERPLKRWAHRATPTRGVDLAVPIAT
jgi:peptidoglycan/LPS O-acetylase OafA/YrhL